ncbi:MAG TPA: carboxypeptidase-like regulatory domain-containing protein, partial [Terriglobia bacterium]|nr:carboxypeptidase-like regulatory domain-containing protein [Terriglobia bacterium]
MTTANGGAVCIASGEHAHEYLILENKRMERTRRWRGLRGAARLAGCFVLLASSAPAQTFQGSFAGTVTDSSGAVIPQASVTAAEQDTGLVRRTQTLADGSYEIVLLPPGRYRLTAGKEGFEKTARGPL